MSSPLLEIRKVSKRFPGVIALNRVNLTLHQGEVLAVIGENGAGKSTLMKILAGIQRPDEGEFFWEGRTVEIESVQDAMRLGIAIIHQELNLADNLDIGANIFLGREPKRFGLIDRTTIREESKRVLERVGLNYSPDVALSRLAIGQQQLVEIAKALSMNARVLIMDEPTSSLSTRETERLFEVVKELRRQGVSVIYISHRLGEVKELADRVQVFRDGTNSGELSREEISHDNMVRLMVGRDVSQIFKRKPHRAGEIVLEVENLATPAFPHEHNSFALRAGEVVGVAGLVGAGRTEMLRVLFGIDDRVSGTIHVAGKPCDFRHPQDAIRAGLALVPEDRKKQGIILQWAVDQNGTLPSLKQESRLKTFVNFRGEAAASQKMIGDLAIKTPTKKQVVQFLSGGNQQKVVLGKWLALKPKVLLLDEPTRGIDVGAKEEIYRLMDKLAAEGLAILFVSSEMEEILSLSDRAMVMHEGKLTGEIPRERLSEEAIMRLATNHSTPIPV